MYAILASASYWSGRWDSRDAPMEADSLNGWRAVNAADQACYLAKREGKNRVRLSA